MTDYLAPPPAADSDMSGMGSLYLAHIGDAVYELMTRTYLCSRGSVSAGTLHRETVALVCAKAQAKGAETVLEQLTDEEAAVFKRGRNARVNGVPKGASHAQYHTATALEALFGWLYLKARHRRLNELFDIIVKELDNAA